MRLISICLLAAVFLAACTSTEKKAEVKSPGLDLSNMDTTVSPGEDFYRYVNGGWIAKTNIPADRGRWGAGSELQEYNNAKVLEVLKKAGANTQKYPEGTDQRKAADFFSIGMDSALAEKAGAAPLKPYLEMIDGIKSRSDIQNYLTEDVLTGGGAFFSFGILPDLKNSRKMAAYLGSGGIGLPERDYYLKADEKSKETRERYKEFIAKLFVLSGDEEKKAKSEAELVLKLETQLAKSMLSKEDSRDPVKQYNPKNLESLSKLTPSVNWPKYFNDLNVKEDTIIVAEPLFMQEYEKVVNNYPIGDIKTYLKAALLRGAAPYLSGSFVNASFDFNSKYLRGIDKMRPRWKRVLDVTDGFLGEAIGKLYVDETFPPEAKQRALEMVENIKLALADHIKALDWMSDSTKKMALKKLSTFSVKIGYPDKWRDYAGLVVEKSPEKSSYLQNVVNASRFQVQHEINKLGKPVDKSEWQMTPQTVNAYYNPLFNEIVFPAGILQPPFYNYQADEAVNYGAIGAVIGHEISHGFDDQGSQFDAEGNLANWWQKEDLEKFREKGKAYVAQFNKYEPLPGVFVQGQFTLGENIGDLGGVAIAYEGLQRFLREKGRPGPIDGFTPEQRFFIAYATVWRAKYKDETLRTQVNTDPHAPSMYRAIAPLTNMKEFYDAFGIKPGDKMYRDEGDRVRIW